MKDFPGAPFVRQTGCVISWHVRALVTCRRWYPCYCRGYTKLSYRLLLSINSATGSMCEDLPLRRSSVRWCCKMMGFVEVDVVHGSHEANNDLFHLPFVRCSKPIFHYSACRFPSNRSQRAPCLGPAIRSPTSHKYL